MICLKDADMRVSNVQDKCEPRYFPELSAAQKAKEETTGLSLSMWKKFTTDDDRPYYYNKETKETCWVPPMEADEVALTAEQITGIIDKCNEDQARQEHFEANVDNITTVQSYIRGFLARKAYLDRKEYIENQTPAVIKLQSIARMLKVRKRFRERLNFLNSQEEAAYRIQAGWKGFKERQAYKGLTKVVNPPCQTVRKFLHLLDQSEVDFSEELKVNKLKQTVVQNIKRNTELESAVTDMDIKIGLLVKNRIELQDVVERNKALKKQQNKRLRTQSKQDLGLNNHGLKSLDAKSRHRLESYEHLFYLLQTEPEYLVRIF